MKQCQNCKAVLNEEDVFCTGCGTKYDPSAPVSAGGNSSFLKYSGYMDNETMFKVAWAKEKGIVKSDIPNEAEVLYRELAMKGHHESMFRYAMIMLEKNPPQKKDAYAWLNLAASQGHVASINYLKTQAPQSMAPQQAAPAARADRTAPKKGASGKELLSGEDIYAKMQKSVVEIQAVSGNSVSQASGFFVSSTGFVLTNAHAVLNSSGRVYKQIKIKYMDKTYPAHVVAVGKPADGKHDSLDIALLFAEGVQRKCRGAELGDNSLCRNGQRVYLIGNSLGNGTCITSGIISDVERAMAGLSYPYIMTDAAANRGNSGGPLINESGEVVGVLVAGIENAKGMNYAIPINVVREFLEYVICALDIPENAQGELRNSRPTQMSVREKVFAGIQILVDVISLITSIIF